MHGIESGNESLGCFDLSDAKEEGVAKLAHWVLSEDLTNSAAKELTDRYDRGDLLGESLTKEVFKLVGINAFWATLKVTDDGRLNPQLFVHLEGEGVEINFITHAFILGEAFPLNKARLN